MGLYNNELSALIRDTREFLSGYSEAIYASQEEADYFRKLYKKPPKELAPPKIDIKLPPKPERIQPTVQKVDAPLPPVQKVDIPLPAAEEPKSASSLKKPDLPIPPIAKGLKALLQRIAPELAILDKIPDDALAKKISLRWKTKNQTAPITLLYYQENADQKALLEQIACALDVYFGPARLIPAETIERDKQWEAFFSVEELKLVICCDYTLWQLRALLQHYKEVPTQQLRTIGGKPLFLLPDLSLYLKDPLLKRSLWKGLCQTLNSLPSSSTKE